LVDAANNKVDQYNSAIKDYNAQLDDLNTKVDEAKTKSEGYPQTLVYVEEYFVNPNLIVPVTLVVPPRVTFTVPSFYYFPTAAVYLNTLSTTINNVASYVQTSAPNPSAYSVVRLTEKNFAVASYKIKW